MTEQGRASDGSTEPAWGRPIGADPGREPATRDQAAEQPTQDQPATYGAPAGDQPPVAGHSTEPVPYGEGHPQGEMTPYGYPPAAPGAVAYPPVAGPKTNGLAIAALVLGIVWVWWIGSILALVFGMIAKNQIDNSGGTQQGRGMAIAGIVLGWVGIGFLLFFVVACGGFAVLPFI